MCFLFFKKKKDIVAKNYEQELFKIYGKCAQFDKNINILLFSDTHNSLSYNSSQLEQIKAMNYDVCLLLGDHSLDDIQEILKVIPKEKIYGIRGNHDKFDDLTYCSIENIHGKIIEINNVRIGAIQGSIKYKETTAPLYTQEDSLEIAKKLDNIDILISHDTFFSYESEEISHDGLKGITEAIYRNHTPIHIHGHLHIEDEKVLLNGTKSYGIYGYKLISL